MDAETPIKFYDIMFQWPTGIDTTTNQLQDLKRVRKHR